MESGKLKNNLPTFMSQYDGSRPFRVSEGWSRFDMGKLRRGKTSLPSIDVAVGMDDVAATE
jgi:hypothetical protein